MKESIFTTLFALALMLPASADVDHITLLPGNVVDYELTPLGPPIWLLTRSISSSRHAEFSINLNQVTDRSPFALRCELFENSLSESPIFSEVFRYDLGDPIPAGSYHYFSGYVEGAWQDLQGFIRLTVISGDVSMYGINVLVFNQPFIGPDTFRGYYHIEPLIVPEPGITWLMGFSVIGWAALVMRKSSRSKLARSKTAEQ